MKRTWTCLLMAILMTFYTHSALSSTATGKLELSNGFVRAMPPSQKTTAAYVEIKNNTKGSITVRDISTPIGYAMFHRIEMVNDMAKMRHMDSLSIPASSTIKLEPGGQHIMIMNIQSSPKRGDSIPFKLTLDDGSTLDFMLDVK